MEEEITISELQYKARRIKDLMDLDTIIDNREPIVKKEI